MPSARELLEQADALMRRNRPRETMSPAMGPRTMTPTISANKARLADFPVLTEALEVPVPVRAAPATGSLAAPASVLRAPVEPELRKQLAQDLSTTAEPAIRETSASSHHAADVEVSRPVATAFTDVPVLTDAIEEIDAALIGVAARGEPSIWNDEAMQGDDSVLGPAPKSIAVIPDSRAIDESNQLNAQAAAAEPAISSATTVAVAASAAELIDEVRMQVLQRIDMFTDTGLREQLGERLKPIVDRASAELVATINQHVGELLRTYVAEAIERELDRLRNELH